jgi:hypothetical protein
MNPSRVHRALHNFSVRKEYEHEIVFSDEKRLYYNAAYTWAIEKFGAPGETWDFYIVKEYEPINRYNMHEQRELWLDVFGFTYSTDATVFILRWC